MPSDRHEALHLILGFCKDHGLLETYRSLCWEAGLDASQEELAPHVSLMRILLDWKRAFEARFNGTPRIIQAVEKQALLAHPVTLSQVHLSSDPQAAGANGVSIGGAAVATSAMAAQPYASLPQASSQDLANGSVQTVATYVASGGTAAGMAPATHIFQQPVQIVGQGGTPQFVLAPQQMGDDLQASLHAPQHSMQHQQSMQARHQQEGAIILPAGLPPRPPGALPSHSSSLYSPPDGTAQTMLQHECSQDASPRDWQGHDGDETGGNSAGRAPPQQQAQQQWVNGGGSAMGMTAGGMMNGAGSLLVATRRASSTGSAPPITRLKKGSEPITQDTFLAVITRVGKGAVASQLFDFRRPQRGSSSSARRSAILQLTDAQHDAMYALAGCEDVNFLISNVQSEVRVAMHQVFDIDKESFTVWFKNRGRNPSKTQHHANNSTGAGGMHKSASPGAFVASALASGSGAAKRPRDNGSPPQ